MHRRYRTPVVLLLTAFVSVSAQAQQEKLLASLKANRFPLTWQNDRLAGPAAHVIEDAIAGTQFVLIGEDHGIAQVPRFVGAVCDLVGPRGFHTMAVETGPLAAAQLQRWIGSDPKHAQLTAFESQYPFSIAFFNMQQENELLSHCSASAQGGPFRVWGLDQELMGSAKLILTHILDTNPGVEAADATRRLLQHDADAYAKAKESGSPGDLFMLTVTDDDLFQLRELLHREGNPESQSLVEQLIKSRDIYQKNQTAGYDSNRERALLMKTNFERGYAEATKADGAPPKVLFKFGAFHMMKGFNPIHNNDLGNFITELADGQGTRSIHILILGVKGTQLRFAGIGHPYAATPLDLLADKDSDFTYLKPLIDNMESSGWTLFDLRGMRKPLIASPGVNKELERLIFGYDLLLLIPDPTASQQIQ